MSTPRKNYVSPYSKSVGQYPSQSQEYISLEMGGINANYQTPIQRGSPYKIQKKALYHRKNDDRNNKVGTKPDNTIHSYVHPSMTEDPWFDLMKRIDAIETSRINLKTDSDNNSE